MMAFLLILISFICLNFNFTIAQVKVDSLLLLLQNHTTQDSAQVDLLNKIAYVYWNQDPAKTEHYGKKALTLAEELDYPTGMARANHRISISYWIRGEYDKALTAALNSLNGWMRLNDRAGISSAYTMIGLIYDDLGQYDEAIDFHSKSLAVSTDLADSSGIATSLNNLGAIHYRRNDFDNALECYKQALTIRKISGDQRAISEALNNIGLVYIGQRNYDSALHNFQEALNIKREVDDRYGQIVSLKSICSIYLEKKRYVDAAKHCEDALQLAQITNIKKWQLEISKRLIRIEKQKGNPEKALQYYDLHTAVKDSVFNETKSKQISDLQTKYETEKKEHEIAALQNDKRIRTLWRNLFAIGLLVSLLVALLIYRFFRFRSEKNRQLFEAQQERTKQLQEIDKMKSRFFANISHEFRTPLTLILGPIESLLSEIKSEKNQQRLLIMHRNARRLLRLINQLLDLSKIESKKLQLHASLGNIVPLIKGIAMSFESIAEKNQIQLSLITPDNEAMLYFEQDKIEQILTNLLSNAFKFTPKQGKITVTLERTKKDGKAHLCISVTDTGVGISEDQLPHIFDRFFQADNSENKEYEGTGIGLSLVKEFANLHGGKITVESKKSQGSTFRVILPFGKEHLKEEQIMPLPSVLNETEPNTDILEDKPLNDGKKAEQDGKPTILLVEDNEDLRIYIRSSLAENFQFEEAVDGKGGWQKSLDLIPDLIISDVMMPKMNGLELCKRLKKDDRTSHIPVILLTARSSEEDKLSGLQSHADDYLVKPFNTRELTARIENLVALRKKLQARFMSSVVIKPKEIEVSSMEQVFLENLMATMEENIGDEMFRVEQLSEQMGMSRFQLHRKLQALTNFGTSQFMRRFRLQRAMDLLKKNVSTVAEIAYTVGFNSPTYFTKCFVEEYGYPPKEVKSKA